MEVHKADVLNDRKKIYKNDKRSHKHSKNKKESKERKNDRSLSNNRPGMIKEKYKQSDISGPITAKTSKLPDAFLDVNYKGKRSMKSIAKVDKKHNDSRHSKDSKYGHAQPPKSSHGKSK
jgi:hypothetical protein